MLVLSRNINETIVVADVVMITVVEVRKSKGRQVVKLGIQAPTDIPVDRLEVYQAKMKEKGDQK